MVSNTDTYTASLWNTAGGLNIHRVSTAEWSDWSLRWWRDKLKCFLLITVELCRTIHPRIEVQLVTSKLVLFVWWKTLFQVGLMSFKTIDITVFNNKKINRCRHTTLKILRAVPPSLQPKTTGTSTHIARDIASTFGWEGVRNYWTHFWPISALQTSSERSPS